MSMSFEIRKDNRNQVNKAVSDAINRALETIGGMAESRAKDNLLAQVHSNGHLVNTITHLVDDSEKRVYIGSTQKDPPYSIYVELGTGIYYNGGRRTSWVYQDDSGNWHKTNGMKPRPYLKPAVEDNLELYQNVMKTELSEL